MKEFCDIFLWYAFLVSCHSFQLHPPGDTGFFCGVGDGAAMDLVVMLGFSALVLSVVISVPQVWLSLVRCKVAGLSFASVSNSVVSSLVWCGFAFSRDDVWLFSSSVVYAVAGLFLVLALFLFGGVFSDWGSALLWFLLAVVASALTISGIWVPAVPSLLVFGAVAWGAPQVWRAWKSASVSGVSAVSWGFVLTDACVWLVYGLLTGTGTLVFWAAVTVICSVLVLVRKALGERPPASLSAREVFIPPAV